MTTEERYRDAVILADELIADFGVPIPFFPGEAIDIREPGSWERTLSRNYGIALIRSDPTFLVEASKSDYSMFTALSLAAADFREAGEELPVEIQNWLVGFLRGEIRAPHKPTGRPQKTGFHILICDAVNTIVDECGLPATRNDATVPPFSACDAVAEALSNAGLEPATFFGVKRIYLAQPKGWPWRR